MYTFKPIQTDSNFVSNTAANSSRLCQPLTQKSRAHVRV